MKRIYLIFLILSVLIFSTSKAYFDFSSCENEEIFFIYSQTLDSANVSSFYCNFSRPFDIKIEKWQPKIKNNFIKIDRNTKKISKLSKQELQKYLLRLKGDFEVVKSDAKILGGAKREYIDFYREHQDIFSLFVKQQLFSKRDLVEISVGISQTPYKKFEKTAGERLLMGGEIISREEWGADENYSNPAVYMKGCEDGSCFVGGPSAPNQLVQNYLQNFHSQDAKDRILKTYDDGRDPSKYYPVDRIIIHHTAGGYKANLEEGMAYMKAVHKYHALTLRWSDIGYHYLIDGEGNIYEGRAGGKSVLGAHVSTHNYGSIGIALMSSGEYSHAMLESLKKLVVYLGEEYELDLSKKTKVRNSDLTGWTQDWAVVAHKELDARKPKDPEIDMGIFRKEISFMIKNKNITKK